jgi:glycosyltransferase involved in cell wall biosynthesis
VRVCCVTRPGYPVDREDSKDLGDLDVQTVDGVVYETLPGPHRRKLGLDRYLLKSAEILAEKARALKAEVIHAASNYETALPALIAARTLGVPFIYEVRGLWEYTAASKRPGWEKTERFTLDCQLEALTAKNADSVLTLTYALAKELYARGVSQSKITLAPNTIDPEAYIPVPKKPELAASLGIRDNDFVIGYIGSVIGYEGIDDLIEALTLLQKRLPRPKALIVGDGDALPELRRLAQAKGIAGQVIFCGKVAPEQIRDYYALLDIIALPRKSETVCQLVSPLKPLEAMALGIPLVVSDAAALREMVRDGETGLVHLSENARSLADTIEVLAKNQELRTRLAENARQYVVENRTTKQAAQNIIDIYKNLTNKQTDNILCGLFCCAIFNYILACIFGQASA